MNISKIKNCTGCMACHDVCPKQCITVGEDRIGHLHPYVNEYVCIDCGKCLKVCQEEHPAKLNDDGNVWAAWRKDATLRQKSSSGGLASAIAEKFIEIGGVVYGCAFVAPFQFQHVRITEVADLARLRGSKYVQSHTAGIFRQIRNDLKGGLRVLFIGTPCQVAAVKQYTDNHGQLFTIDLICHGVPSLRMLRESLPHNFETLGISDVEFRASTKYHFSAKSGILVVYQRPLATDLYLKGFFTALYYRDSCYHCRYATRKRIGDVTLGDFWGAYFPKEEELRGVSLCIVNTKKGEEIFNSVSDCVERQRRNIEEALQSNKQLSSPMPCSLRSRIFRALYPIIGFKMSVVCAIPEIVIKNRLIYMLKDKHLKCLKRKKIQTL